MNNLSKSEDIFTYKKPNTPKRKTHKIHFALGSRSNPSPYCGRSNAEHYTYIWKLVDCAYCKQTWIDEINRIRERRKKRIEKRKAILYMAKKVGLTRSKNEKWKDFKKRVNNDIEEYIKKEEKKREKEEYDALSCLDFTTFPLDEEKLQFPLGLVNTYDFHSGETTITIDKKKYIDLLKELQHRIKKQLKTLK